MKFTERFIEHREISHKKFGEAEVTADIEIDDKLVVYIYTENLFIISLNENDLNFYFNEIFGNQEVMNTFGEKKIFGKEETQNIVKRFDARWIRKKYFSFFTSFERDTDEEVGYIGLVPC